MRSGTSMYVLDTCRELVRRGHQPVVYSTQLGVVADALRAMTIPVASDIADLTVRPDLIWGMHHIETVSAVLQHPGVPCLAFCHGWLPWEENPIKHPRVLRYIAVDDLCRERLTHEHGIAPSMVSVVLNFVDLELFRPRTRLPLQPEHALVISNNVNDRNILPAIRAACERAGIALDVRGAESGTIAEAPHELLPHYDIVFAKARAALEAMAVGAAVIPCDVWGMGSFVTSSNYEQLRRLNFGIRTLRNPVTEDRVLSELKHYNPIDAAAVSQRVRREADMGAAVDELLAISQQVVTEGAALKQDPAAEARAIGVYLRSFAPRYELITSLQRQIEQLKHEKVQADV